MADARGADFLCYFSFHHGKSYEHQEQHDHNPALFITSNGFAQRSTLPIRRIHFVEAISALESWWNFQIGHRRYIESIASYKRRTTQTLLSVAIPSFPIQKSAGTDMPGFQRPSTETYGRFATRQTCCRHESYTIDSCRPQSACSV